MIILNETRICFIFFVPFLKFAVVLEMISSEEGNLLCRGFSPVSSALHMRPWSHTSAWGLPENCQAILTLFGRPGGLVFLRDENLEAGSTLRRRIHRLISEDNRRS